jgi:hypothetical protein
MKAGNLMLTEMVLDLVYARTSQNALTETSQSHQSGALAPFLLLNLKLKTVAKSFSTSLDKQN